jgi:hypothetical protein
MAVATLSNFIGGKFVAPAGGNSLRLAVFILLSFHRGFARRARLAGQYMDDLNPATGALAALRCASP